MALDNKTIEKEVVKIAGAQARSNARILLSIVANNLAEGALEVPEIEPLGDSPKVADCAAKINEIIDILHGLSQ